MFKNSRSNRQNIIDQKWFEILHDDLIKIHNEISQPKKGKKDLQLSNQLKGFIDSILLDACSGIGYIYEGKFYKNITDIENVNDLDETASIERVMSTDYLIHMLNQLLEK